MTARKPKADFIHITTDIGDCLINPAHVIMVQPDRGGIQISLIEDTTLTSDITMEKFVAIMKPYWTCILD